MQAPPKWIIQYNDGTEYVEILATKLGNIIEELNGHEEATFTILRNTAANRALVLSDQTTRINYDVKEVYTGILKAPVLYMTKIGVTIYNSVYELLQRRDYTRKWTSTAANIILADITGSGGVGSDSFGNTNAESGEDYTNLGHKEGPRYQMINLSGATITSIKAYIKVDSSSKVKIAVYADSSGSPAALLGVSDEVTVTNTSKAWITFPFSTPVAVTALAYYWFIVMTDNQVYWATNWSGSTPHKVGTENYPDGFSNPFGTVSKLV